MTRILSKLNDYTEMGIRNIFVIDSRTELTYRFQDQTLSPLRATQETLAGSAAILDTEAVKALRD